MRPFSIKIKVFELMDNLQNHIDIYSLQAHYAKP